MKIVITCKEALSIVEDYYRKEGFNVIDSRLQVKHTGRIVDSAVEIEVEGKVDKNKEA